MHGTRKPVLCKKGPYGAVQTHPKPTMLPGFTGSILLAPANSIYNL